MTNLIDFLYGKTREFAGSIQVNSNALIKGKLQVDDTTEATTTTDGSLQTDGGLSVAKNAVVGGDIYTTAWTTWTPTVTGSGGGTAPTYTTTNAYYKRVGNLVFWQLELTNTEGGTAGSGADDLLITVPVTSSATLPAFSQGQGMVFNTGGTAGAIVAGYLNGNFQLLLASTNTFITLNDQSHENRRIRLSGFYEAG